MIKKCLKGLCTLWLILLPISFSSAINELNPVWIWQDIGGDNSNFCLINSNLSFNCSATDNVIASYTSQFWTDMWASYWWRSDWLGFYYRSNSSNSIQWVITWFTFCAWNYVDSDSFSQYRDNCNTTYTYEQFKNYASSHNLRKWGRATFSNLRWNWWPVFVFDDWAFRLSFDIGSYYTNLLYWTYRLKDFGLDWNPMSADYSNVWLIPNPWVYPTYSSDPWTTEITDNDYIDYYQNNPNYKFTADMCWIWTTDLTSNYGSNVAFHQWSGYNLFQFYWQLYWTTYKLSDLDTWLNSWLVNFNTFFKWYNRYSDWTPYYVLRYNWIDNLVIDRTNLTNPFIDNKVAYYFMSSNICDSVSDCSNISQELAIYCYKSLNMKNNSNYNITYDPDSNLENNVNQWTINKYNSQWFNRSWNLVINSADWSWTPLDYFSWWDEEFTWNFVDYFMHYFNKTKSIFDINVIELEFWVLPGYIIAFLLALILFRFLSH